MISNVCFHVVKCCCFDFIVCYSTIAVLPVKWHCGHPMATAQHKSRIGNITISPFQQHRRETRFLTVTDHRCIIDIYITLSTNSHTHTSPLYK